MVRRASRLEWLLRLVAIGLGLLQAWATRDFVDNDTVSYLDLGDAVLRGDWPAALNFTWGPLHGVLAAATVQISRATARHEYAAVHGLVFLEFLLALFAFGFLLRELLAGDAQGESAAAPAVPRDAWLLLGYLLFTWSALDVIRVAHTSPDMLVAALVYAATGLLVRIGRGTGRRRDFVCLGLLLGTAYLTKPFMFVGAVVFLAAGALAARREGGRKGFALAVLAFFLLAGPYVFLLSRSRGRFTAGDSGVVNYAWHVNEIRSRHWQGGPAGAGTPLHPTRPIAAAPPTFEFDRPIRVTYPLWSDPAYWYEGLRVHLQPARQASIFLANAARIAETASGPSGLLLAGLLLLALLRPDWREVGRWARAHFSFAAPSLAALVLYALVHVEGRYIGAFLAVVLLWSFMALGAGTRPELSGVFRALAIAGGVLLVVPGINRADSPRYYSSLLHPRAASVNPGRIWVASPAAPWEVAEAIRVAGLRPGDRIGTVQYANHADAAWARLARLKIVAEVYGEAPGDDFCGATPAARAAALDAIVKVGVRAIVSDSSCVAAPGAAWTPLGETGYFVFVPPAPAIP